ncbi:hypothetical protein Q8F55_002903 [Vanrija albida]|uniref:Ribosome assembly protein 3 n=1 Tax=Vanrija albida TaxID=181172 RepID=A0ABR3QBM3_9TREE
MPPRAKASAPKRSTKRAADSSPTSKKKNRAPSLSLGSVYGDYTLAAESAPRSKGAEEEEHLSDTEVDDDASADDLIPQSLDFAPKPRAKAKPKKAPKKKANAVPSDVPSDPRDHAHKTIKGLCGTIRSDMKKVDATQKSYLAKIDTILKGITSDPLPTDGLIKLFETRAVMFQQLNGILNNEEAAERSAAVETALSNAYTYFTVDRPAATQRARADLQHAVDAAIRDAGNKAEVRRDAFNMIASLSSAIDCAIPRPA